MPSIPTIPVWVCSAAQPYRIVTQFHGINYKTVTLQREIHHHQLITKAIQWIILCSQLLEAVDYLHCEAHLLHNDIKEDNVLLTQGSEQLCSPIRALLGIPPQALTLHITLF